MKFAKKVTPFFKDERGELSYLLDKEVNFTSALLITCKKGAIRANHYHKKDTHYSYMISGKMEYYYRDLKAKTKKVNKIIVKAGEIVCTPPNIEHAMKFLEQSSFIALTTEPRDQKKYEHDTVRVPLINNE